VFESRVLKTIFGPEREELAGNWSFIIYTLHKIKNQIKENEMGWACGTNGREIRSAYRALVGKYMY
jgi:hypothetical protein